MLKNNNKGLAGAVEVVVIVLILAVVGFAVYKVTSGDDTPNASLSELEVLPSDLTGVLAVEDMKSLIVDDLADGEILGVSLEYDDGVLVYELMLSDGRVLYVNASTGEVLDVDTDVEFDENATPLDLTGAISVDEAIAKAKAQFGDKDVVKVEVEFEDGVLVYSVRFSDGSRVDVEALTGEIARVDDESSDNQDEDENDDDSDDNDDSDDDDDRDDDRSGSSSSDDDDSDDDDDDDSDDDDSDDDKEDDDKEDNSGSGSN